MNESVPATLHDLRRMDAPRARGQNSRPGTSQLIGQREEGLIEGKPLDEPIDA
jgi:hypothetical protein